MPNLETLRFQYEKYQTKSRQFADAAIKCLISDDICLDIEAAYDMIQIIHKHEGREKTVRQRGTMSNKSHIILEASEIERILTRMTHEILEVHKGVENLALIGIQTRGVYLAKRIRSMIHKIEGEEVPSGDMDITLYRDDWTRISNNPLVQTTDIPFSVDDRQVILIDDVLFTGRTIRAAMDSLIDFGRPERIELAVLVDRGHRELPIQADYVGKFVETRRSETVNVLLADVDAEENVLIETAAD